jgi:hydrogenase-4 component E
MSTELFQQLLATTTGLLLLTAVLQVWGRSTMRAIGLLVLQGVALAGLVLTVGLHAGEGTAPLVAGLLLLVKAVVMPWAMLRTARLIGVTRERSARVNPAVELIGAAALTLLAYAVSGPLLGAHTDLATQAVPVGISLVLLGFWQLLVRSSAITQLVGFLMLDNGIAAISFLTSGGLPLVVELGATLDVLLVVLILGVLVVRMQAERGHIDISELRELHD